VLWSFTIKKKKISFCSQNNQLPQLCLRGEFQHRSQFLNITATWNLRFRWQWTSKLQWDIQVLRVQHCVTTQAIHGVWHF